MRRKYGKQKVENAPALLSGMPVLPVRRSVRGGLRGEFLGTDCAFSLPQADGTLLLIEVKDGKRRVRHRRGVARRRGGAHLKTRFRGAACAPPPLKEIKKTFPYG